MEHLLAHSPLLHCIMVGVWELAEGRGTKPATNQQHTYPHHVLKSLADKTPPASPYEETGNEETTGNT